VQLYNIMMFYAVLALPKTVLCLLRYFYYE